MQHANYSEKGKYAYPMWILNSEIGVLFILILGIQTNWKAL